MLAIERKNEILSILQKEQRVLVSELSQRYNVTEETIRRDLEKLEREGQKHSTATEDCLGHPLCMQAGLELDILLPQALEKL